MSGLFDENDDEAERSGAGEEPPLPPGLFFAREIFEAMSEGRDYDRHYIAPAVFAVLAGGGRPKIFEAPASARKLAEADILATVNAHGVDAASARETLFDVMLFDRAYRAARNQLARAEIERFNQ